MAKTTMLIGFTGLIGSGKNAASAYLVQEFGFKQDSFAATLKDAVAAVFGWDRHMLEGLTAESRTKRETVDAWWAERLNMPDLTPRLVLQLWGTEVCRKSFHNDIWIASLENKLRNSSDDIVITDCRFPNEVNAIRNAGGKVIRIIRGKDPEWFKYAEQAFHGDKASAIQLKKYNIHVSETSWAGVDFDYVIDNNSTIDDLYTQLSKLVA